MLQKVEDSSTFLATHNATFYYIVSGCKNRVLHGQLFRQLANYALFVVLKVAGIAHQTPEIYTLSETMSIPVYFILPKGGYTSFTSFLACVASKWL